MVEFREVTEEKVSSGEELQGVDLELPSRGVDYGGVMPGGVLLVRPPKVREVKFIAQMTTATYEENLTRVLQSLIMRPKIDPWTLTNGDRSYLHLWIRTQIHPDYHLTVVCPRCSHIDKRYVFPLGEVPIKGVPKEYDGPTELLLPASGKKVRVRLDTGRDEQDVQGWVEKDFDKWVATYTAAIVEVEGEKISFEKKYAWVEDLPPGDYLFIREFFNWAFHGPDYANCKMTCRKCGEERPFRLPFRAEFYLPSVPFGAAVRDALLRRPVREGGVSDAEPGRDGDRGVPVAPPEGE